MRYPSKTLGALLAAAVLGLGMTGAAQAAPAPASAESQAQAQKCLQCHGGSLEALAEQTKDWKDEFGDHIQPHVYIDGEAEKPHQGKKVLPDCVSCHGIHEQPPKPGMKMKEPTFSSCYGCHHMENFQKCSSSGCHEKK